MKRAIQLILLMVSLPLLASAQTSEYSRGLGYAYFSPGVTSPSSVTWAHVGVGGEGFFTKYLGAGAEVGYLTPIRSFSDGVGTLSPNFVVRFRAKDEHNKIEPFVTSGYILFFRNGHANGYNFGGGVNYWLKDHIGLRFEFRDNVWTSGGVIHYLGFRIGATFR